MATRVQVTDDFLVAVPDEARQRLKIERGDSLLVEVRDNAIILTPEPHDYARRLRGLHREVWEVVDVDAYVRRERDAWGRAAVTGHPPADRGRSSVASDGERHPVIQQHARHAEVGAD